MTGAPIALADAAARRRAATSFERNQVVVAGAGTGKTSLLVERFLNLIGSGEATMDRVVAITFTEKAAAELRQRVATGLDALRRLAAGDGPRPSDRNEAGRAARHLLDGLGLEPAAVARRCLDALERLDRARVSTIHGLCSELLRDHPVEAGVDPDFRVDTGEQARALVEEAWEAFLAEELGPEAPRGERWGRVLDRIPLDRVRRVAGAAAGFGFPLDALAAGAEESAVRAALVSEARAILPEVRAWVDAPPVDSGFTVRCFATVERVLRELVDNGFAGLPAMLAAEAPGVEEVCKRTSLTSSKKLTDAGRQRMNALHRRGRMLLRELRGYDPGVCEDLRALLEPFAGRFRRRLLAEGQVTFDALLALARDLLRDHPAVRRELRRGIAALLVDEFQDTDPLQYEIVFFLAERDGGEATDAWTARLAPGKLFVVGDPKQSIYRFRGADYAAFREAVERIVEAGGERLELTANFRSVGGVLQPVNRLFQPGDTRCWEASPHQPDYAAVEATRHAADDRPRVEVWTLETDPRCLAHARRRQEGELIAEAIARGVGDGSIAGGYSSVAVLFRAFTSLAQYLRPLRERGIPFVVDGNKEFLRRPEIAQSLAVLRALANPADQPALLAYLRSPAGGVSDPELARWAAGGGRWSWAAAGGPAAAADCPGVVAAFRRLRELRREIRDLPPDAAVRHALDRTLALPLAAAAFEGAQRVANVSKLAAAAGQLARDGRLSLEELVDVVQDGGLADLESDSPLADDEADAVLLTSIHKMKGLESRLVILPDLARDDHQDRADDAEVRLVRTGRGRAALGLHVKPLDASEPITNTAWVLSRIEEARHEEAEETRVLYVALTRARERLVLVSGPGRGTSRVQRALAAWDYNCDSPPGDGARLAGGAVLHRTVRAPERERGPADERPARATAAVERYRAALARLGLAAVAEFAAPSGLEEQHALARRGAFDDDRMAGPAVAASRDAARAAGIVVHELLERWDGRDTAALRQLQEALCARVARDERVDPQALAAETGEILAGFLRSPLAPEFREIETVGRELPLLLREDGRVWRGSIDLLYRDAGGELVVADYKTDREHDPGELARRYGGQLAVYARGVRAALGLERTPAAELWALRSGRRIRLPPSDEGLTSR